MTAVNAVAAFYTWQVTATSCYVIPYAITGILDEHPRAALELRSGEKKENYREFWDSLTGSETAE